MASIIEKLFPKYKGLWVSITKDYTKVLASSSNLKELVKEIEEKRLGDGVIMKVPTQKYQAYVG